MSSKSKLNLIGLLLFFVGLTSANASVIDFSTYGFAHDQTLTGNEFIASGLQVTSADRIMMACGGDCISVDDQSEGWAYGEAIFNFVLPGTTVNGSVNQLAFDSVNGDLSYQVFDTAGLLFASGFGDYSYSGSTDIDYFTVDYNYDGIYSISTDQVAVVETRVPAPATLALMGLGLAAAGFSRKKKIL